MILETAEKRSRQDTKPLVDQSSYHRRGRGFKTKTKGTFNGLKVEGDTVVLTRTSVSPLYDVAMLGVPAEDIPLSVTLVGSSINPEEVTRRSRFYRPQSRIHHR